MNAEEDAAPSHWNEALETELRALFAEGVELAVIAHRLSRRSGLPISRSAVAAKLHRLGLRRGRVLPRLSAERIVSHCERRRRLQRPASFSPMPAGAAEPRPLTALEPGVCRWPVNDPGPERMHEVLFCAAPSAGTTYCERHTRCARPARPPPPLSLALANIDQPRRSVRFRRRGRR